MKTTKPKDVSSVRLALKLIEQELVDRQDIADEASTQTVDKDRREYQRGSAAAFREAIAVVRRVDVAARRARR